MPYSYGMRSQNFHLPLPAEIYMELRKAAEELHAPATQIVRSVLESWLRERKKKALHQQITLYAEAVAGTEFDLIEDLESASTEHLFQAAERTPSFKSKKKRVKS
jgi:hypothetical protein